MIVKAEDLHKNTKFTVLLYVVVVVFSLYFMHLHIRCENVKMIAFSIVIGSRLHKYEVLMRPKIPHLYNYFHQSFFILTSSGECRSIQVRVNHSSLTRCVRRDIAVTGNVLGRKCSFVRT